MTRFSIVQLASHQNESIVQVFSEELYIYNNTVE